MESRRRKNYFRSPRSSTLQSNISHYRTVSDEKTKYQYICSPRLQKQSFRRINEFLDRNNFKSVIQRKKLLGNITKKQAPSPESAEEEERRKKLSDTANKLLSKIKTLAGSNDASQEVIDSNRLNALGEQNGLNGCALLSETETTISRKSLQISTGQKPKRIAHSRNKTNLCGVKKLSTKNVNRMTRMSGVSRKLEVNVAKVRDFQNRIQHKLINEIMQMPKINLQNVLNNPKINPIMQVKISHLVKENRLLIAQKLRALAESKMNSKDSPMSSQLVLMDIDKLIDPVIETDLSALPLDLIKQMENIFQVQFDYSADKIIGGVDIPVTEAPPSPPPAASNQRHPCEDPNSCMEHSSHLLALEDPSSAADDPGSKVTPSRSTDPEAGDCQKIQTQMFPSLDISGSESANNDDNDDVNDGKFAEDLTVYECSTDEDEEEPETRDFGRNHRAAQEGGGCEKASAALYENVENSRELENSLSFGRKRADGGGGKDVEFSTLTTGDEGAIVPIPNVETHPVEPIKTGPKLPPPPASTECKHQSVSVQTSELPAAAPAFLYGVPVPSESKDETCSSLLEEASAIQHLVNRLNERRFMIFLKLARIQAHGQFIQGSFTQHNFVESVTNGSIYLADKLNKYFASQGISRGGRCKKQKRKKKRNERLKQ